MSVVAAWHGETGPLAACFAVAGVFCGMRAFFEWWDTRRSGI